MVLDKISAPNKTRQYAPVHTIVLSPSTHQILPPLIIDNGGGVPVLWQWLSRDSRFAPAQPCVSKSCVQLYCTLATPAWTCVPRYVQKISTKRHDHVCQHHLKEIEYFYSPSDILSSFCSTTPAWTRAVELFLQDRLSENPYLRSKKNLFTTQECGVLISQKIHKSKPNLIAK